MSWQDELRRLDAELVNGQISYAAHRKLRDELLAAASGATAVTPVAAPRSYESQQRWGSENPGRMPQEPPPPASEPPQPPAKTAPSAADLLATQRPTTAPSPADFRRTEAIPFPRLVSDPRSGPRPTLETPHPLFTDRPSRVEPPQGPQTPTADTAGDTDRAPGGKPTWLFLALGVLLVLALVIGGSWWLGSGSHQTPVAVGSGEQLPPSPEAALADRLPVLPGVPDPNNSTVSIPKGAQLDLYPAAAADVFSRYGATEVIYRASSNGSSSYFLLVIPTASAENARAVVEYLRSGALTGGFTQLQADRLAVTGANGDRLMNGSWYSSGSTVVDMWISQPRGGDPAALKLLLDQAMAQLRQTLPAE
jgi:hypothetical protein